MRNEIIVQKCLAYSVKVIGYCDGLDYEQFAGDSKLVEACVFNLSQIGELANKLEKSFADAHPEIPWQELYGLRNRIVHDYDGVNLQLIWQIIQEDLPPLRDALDQIAHE